MKFNLRKLASLGLAGILCVSVLAGCGKTKPQEAETQSKQAGQGKEGAQEGPIELTVWIRAAAKENNQTITYDEFNASQDKIKVNYQVYGDNYTEVLKLALNAGEGPDIFEMNGTNLQTLVQAGLVAPINEYLTEDIKSKFIDSAFATTTIDGNIYAIPDMLRYMRLFYNKKLFEKAGLDPNTPPKSLEEMYEYAKKITEAGKGEYYGFGLAMKSAATWERTIDLISALSGQTGLHAFDYKTGRFDFAKQKPIIEYFAKLFKEGLIMPGTESMDVEVVRANFATDKIGMYVDGSWMINGYNNEIEAAKDCDWATALISIPEGTKRAKDIVGYENAKLINANSPHKKEAFEAIQYELANLYEAPTRKNPNIALPSQSLMPEVNDRINSTEKVAALKGMAGMTEGVDQLSAFKVTPHSYLTLDGDDRNKVYPLLIIAPEQMDIDKELQTLSERYNKALDQAISEGILKQEDLKPEGFDYYTR